MKVVVSMLLLTLLAVPVVGDEFDDEYRDPDPWIGLNKVTYELNEIADRFLIRPVARGYKKFTPRFARVGVGNFFSNLEDVGNAVNNILQGKLKAGAGDALRVTLNTTIGIGGLFDPATAMGLDEHDEDWGQTLATWGIPSGPYLVLPFFGPSTLRDAFGRFLNPPVDPIRYLYPVNHRNILFGIRALHYRSDLLTVESVIFGDRYVFYRDAYLQRRNYLINDGEVNDSFMDDF